MSLVYSNTTTKAGIIQRIEQELGFTDAFISGNSTRLTQWTASINLALDNVLSIIFKADGRWQFDDSNHTDYPIITTNLVASQRDYAFTADENSNLILDIYRVLARSSTTTPYYDLKPVDVQGDNEFEIGGLADGLNNEGVPKTYDKTANGIFVDPIPSSTITSGLKIYINREGSYFTTSDTTKKPGFAGLYHEYLVLEPAYRYARAHRLDSQEALRRDLKELEQSMIQFYSRREKDERPYFTNERINYE